MTTRLLHTSLAGGNHFPIWWPPDYRTHCWREDISFLVDGHQAIIHIAGGNKSFSLLMATKLSNTLLAGGHIFPSRWPPGYRTHCWRNTSFSLLMATMLSYTLLAGGHLSPRCWPPCYRTHSWRENIAFLVNGHHAIVHIAGGRTSLS